MDRCYPGCSFDSHQPDPHLPEAQDANAQWQPSTAAHPPLPTQATLASTTNPPTTQTMMPPPPAPPALTPREMRNRAEKLRRSDMNQSIDKLASILPAVVKTIKKLDKTSILRFTAHYLRSYRHVFGKSLKPGPTFSVNFAHTVLESMKGFLLATTYKGLVVVVSPNIRQYLGYNQVELFGQSLFSIVHADDHQLLRDQLYPRSCRLTCNGELFLSMDENAAKKAAEALMKEKREFVIRIKKATRHRSDPIQYVTCYVDGSFRKSDRAGVHVDQPIPRRTRARARNPYASGNDIVFIGMVRPMVETFATERKIEAFTMMYRTRHSIDGGIMECEQRISLVTGYMVEEVKGVNAMNFMHRDDVKFVIVALRQMYVKHYIMGESCYRLMNKNGQFIYLQTRGTLDVDPISKEATSFVCTNTLVSEQEGIKLIKIMKQKFSNEIFDNESIDKKGFSEQKVNEKQNSCVEDPKQLEKDIYHLVTDLPSPRIDQDTSKETNSDLSIIPPKKDQIKKAIEKSYSVIKTLKQLAPKTQLENMTTEQSLKFTNISENTPNDQNHSQPVPASPQQFNQNPSQYGYQPQRDFSWANVSFTSSYIGPLNSAGEEYGQPIYNEAQATVLHVDMNKQVQYNNPYPNRLYGATSLSYYENNACNLQEEVPGNTNSSYSLNIVDNNEQNLQCWSTQATADTNGMNALAYQFSEASYTLNSGVTGSNEEFWAEYNQEFSTKPQSYQNFPEKSKGQTHNVTNNVIANGDEDSVLLLSEDMDELVHNLLTNGDLFKTAAEASQALMGEGPWSAETKDGKIAKIMAELNQLEYECRADTFTQGPPVAAVKSAVSTQKNNFYLEQPSQVNLRASLDPYEFNEDDPMGLTGRPLSYLHAGEPPSSDKKYYVI